MWGSVSKSVKWLLTHKRTTRATRSLMSLEQDPDDVVIKVVVLELVDVEADTFEWLRFVKFSSLSNQSISCLATSMGFSMNVRCVKRKSSTYVGSVKEFSSINCCINFSAVPWNAK